MTPFRDLPIRRKLLLMTLASSAAALVLAAAGFLTWDIVQRRREIVADVQVQGRLIADESAAPLFFNDPRVARETLDALEVRPRVEVGCLYTAAGALFEQYVRDAGVRCPASPPAQTRYGFSRFEVVTPVTHERERVGTLYVTRELGDLADRLEVGAATLLGLLALAIATAFAVAGRIQRAVTAPLLRLADTAATISETRDYSLRATPASKDEIGAVVRAFNDMLDRIAERDAELSTANRLKDEFLATLSHELRTPLNAVLGWTRVLRSTKVEAATQERALESIERNARAQARLIEDLLEVSRIVTGRLRLQVRDTDLAAIVTAAAEIVQPAAAAKQIELSVHIGRRPALTAGDPDRLQQVIWNVLSNAVKFTPAGGRIAVRLEQSDGHRLTVQDTGTGIDPRFMPFIFEAFRQADGSASREHGGLGLGLAIAKQLVELHGGTITARSEGKGAGATFEIYLPSVVAAPHDTSPRGRGIEPLASESVDATLLRDRHVLVVDDEEDARILLETSLRQYGADVTTASTAAEAFEAIDRRHPDVILSDIGMPHEDGYAFVRRLRARAPSQGGEIPAVAVTAYASDGDRSSSDTAGYQAHVAKPFEPGTLARLVSRLANPKSRVTTNN